MRKYIAHLIVLTMMISLFVFSDEFASLKIIVNDKYDQPLQNALVIIHPKILLLGNRSKLTDENGIVEFNYLLPGEYEIITYYKKIRYDKDDVKESITRKNVKLKTAQKLTISITINPEEHLSDYIPSIPYGRHDHMELSESKNEYNEIFKQFQNSSTVKDNFNKNYFVVFPSQRKDLYNTYRFLEEDKESVFISSDIVLHTCHLFFDYSMRIIELENLYRMTQALSSRMETLSLAQIEKSKINAIKKSVRLNTAFFEVAEKLLNPDKQLLNEEQALVESELELINNFEGLNKRPLLDYLSSDDVYTYEDYSQYRPRGHYTRNENFKKYFKAMMWLGRMSFKLKPGPSLADIEAGRMMTLQALLMTDALMNDEEALKNWRALDRTIGFFMGKSDDLSPEDYFPLISEVFGANGSSDRFADKVKLDIFIEKAMKLSNPKIVSGLSLTTMGMFQETSKGFSFLGQRSIPDGYIMQELVYSRKENGTILNYIGRDNPFTLYHDPEAGPIRGYPRALDVMAALGSDRALDILKQEGDTEYTEYNKQMEMLRKTFTQWTDSDWSSSIYNRRLYSIIPLLNLPKSDNLLKFMKSVAWLDKSLCTALGAWLELRHDTILYAKQTYGITSSTSGYTLDKLEYPCGYLEPYPETYERLQKAIQLIKNIALDLNPVNSEVIKGAEYLEKLLGRLIDISKAELEGKTLSKEDYDYLQVVGNILASLKGFSPELMGRIASGSDDRMDVIADVFTNPWEKQVLEEGVGSPMYIFVYVDDAKGRRICRGMVYSYYEFKHPMNDRLSDEKWQRMGERNERPAMPAWTKSFIVTE